VAAPFGSIYPTRRPASKERFHGTRDRIENFVQLGDDGEAAGRRPLTATTVSRRVRIRTTTTTRLSKSCYAFQFFFFLFLIKNAWAAGSI